MASHRGVQRPSRYGGPGWRALTRASLTCYPRRSLALSSDLPVTSQVQPAPEQMLRRGLRILTFRTVLVGKEFALRRVYECG
jgi:hypothetical protein